MALTTGGMDAAQQFAMRAALSQERAALQGQLDHHYKAIQEVLERGCKAMEEHIMLQSASDTKDCGNGSSHKDQMSPLTCNVLNHKYQSTSQESLFVAFPELEEAEQKPMGHRGIAPNKQLTASLEAIKELMGDKNVAVAPQAKRRSRLDRLFHGKFEHVVCGLILANSLVTFVHTQELGEKANASLGLEHSHWPHADDVFDAIEAVFAVAFIIEIGLRVFTYGIDFFKDWHNIAEACIVVLMALDSILTLFLGHLFNLAVLRLLRIVRVVRAFRIIRAVGNFHQLRIMLNTIVSSFMAVLWSMLLMLILHLILAMLLCQTLHDYIVDDSHPMEHREWMNRMYGSGLKSLWTVFQMTFSGCWPNWVGPVVDYASPWYASLFCFYVICVIFTVTRIISAMFLKETLAIASADEECMVREKIKDTTYFRTKLHAMFLAADTSGDGLLTEDELNEFLEHQQVRVLLGKLGVDACDSHLLFKLLDTGSGHISRTAFMHGLNRLKGEAKSMDLIPLVNTCHQILDHCVALRTATLQPHEDSVRSTCHQILDHCIALRTATLQPPEDLVPATRAAPTPALSPQCTPWSWMTARRHRISQHETDDSAFL
eukprot:CAMPEP_0172838994 /NCGR_PEP_ID=MMETSP1075-20121228/28255_1 /TAXON_ID=2916 /ORGANISM="Ceratium fusus, Strain PA161109" /LENGTH=601 /DNA_ID=CAMNT_0013682581 /DNA_START=15 /DNA_END=1816 /DNA_ORIENTATION=+